MKPEKKRTYIFQVTEDQVARKYIFKYRGGSGREESTTTALGLLELIKTDIIRRSLVEEKGGKNETTS